MRPFPAVIQVIDARDPLTYRSDDLEQYARDIAPHKGSLLLLNKADLLSVELRTAWADYFDEQGVSYVFWSAKAAADAAKQDNGGLPICQWRKARPLFSIASSRPAYCYNRCPSQIGVCEDVHVAWPFRFAGRPQPQRNRSDDPRARVLTADELLAVFQQKAQEAVDKASPTYMELRVIAYLSHLKLPWSLVCWLLLYSIALCSA